MESISENHMGPRTKTIHFNNGREYTIGTFKAFFKEGIARHHTVLDTPQENGVGERMNKTLVEK